MPRLRWIILLPVFFSLFLYKPPLTRAATCADFPNPANDEDLNKRCAFLFDRDLTYGSNLSCSGTRTFYQCPGVSNTCAVESFNGCSGYTSVCAYNNDGYTCNTYCSGLLNQGGAINTPPSGSDQNNYCGYYFETNPNDTRPNCPGWWSACLSSCTGAGGSNNYACPTPAECTSAHQCITQAPNTSLTANGAGGQGGGSTTIPSGGSVQLAWASLRAQTCDAASTNNVWSGGKLPQDSAWIGPLYWSSSLSTYNFVLTCSNTAGNGNSPVTMVVNISPPSSSLSCTPSSQSIQPGGLASFTASGGTGTLSWSAPDGNPGIGSGTSFGPVQYESSGTKTVTVTSSGGQSAQCTVNVGTCTGCSASTACSSSGVQSGQDSCGNPCTISVPYCSGVTPPPTGGGTTEDCSTSASATGNTTGNASTDMLSGRNRVDWFVNSTYIGTNSGPSAGLTGLTPGTSYSAQAVQWDSGGENEKRACDSSSPAFTTGGGGSGSGGSGGTGGSDGSCGNCNAAEPACGSVSWGTCSNNPSQSCSRPGQACSGTGQVRLRFFNADCTTPYNQPETINLLEDDNDGQEKHNSLFYPLYKAEAQGWSCTDDEGVPYPGENAPNIDDDKCETGHFSNGVSACEFAPWHPYKDPGYQINADGTIGGCPSQNMDGGWFDEEICDDEGNNCYKEWKHSGNDTCIETPNEPSTFPRCFRPQTSQHIEIKAGAPTRSFSFDGTYDEIRARTFAFSVGAPTAYKLKVIGMCYGGNDAACAAYFSGGTNQGNTVKEFDTPIAGHTNYWANPFESVNSNAFVLAYDICVKGTTYKISGQVYQDNNANGAKDGGEPGYGGARVFVNGSPRTTDSSGNYIASELAGGENYTVDLELPAGYRLTQGPDPVTVSNLSGDTTVNFGITPIAVPWFQVKDSDIAAFNNLVSRIPVQCSGSCSPYLDLIGDGGFPGVPMYGGSNLNLGYGQVSQTGWVANSRYSGDLYKYAYFLKKLPATATNISGSIAGSSLVSQSGSSSYNWFYSNGNLTITGDTSIGTKKIVLFVNGTLTIQGKVNLTKGSGFFATIAAGDINIDPGVANASSPAIEGVYVADGIIRTGTNSSSPDSKLIIRGSLVAWNSIILQRDLDPPPRLIGTNETNPAELVEYAPDLMLNFPKELLRDNPVWEEIAP